jgi:hypothetical protein
MGFRRVPRARRDSAGAELARGETRVGPDVWSGPTCSSTQIGDPLSGSRRLHRLNGDTLCRRRRCSDTGEDLDPSLVHCLEPLSLSLRILVWDGADQVVAPAVLVDLARVPLDDDLVDQHLGQGAPIKRRQVLLRQ